jgi:hypothetical protein
MPPTGLSFGISVIVIYLLFVICDLNFLPKRKSFYLDQTGRLLPAAELNI